MYIALFLICRIASELQSRYNTAKEGCNTITTRSGSDVVCKQSHL